MAKMRIWRAHQLPCHQGALPCIMFQSLGNWYTLEAAPTAKLAMDQAYAFDPLPSLFPYKLGDNASQFTWDSTHVCLLSCHNY